MKYGRLILGLLAIVVALWIIVGEQMSGASADAVVNAPVVTVRATVAGNLSVPARRLGARVTEGEVIASIEDPLVDRVRLDDLLMEARLEEAMRVQIETLLAETDATREALLQRTEIFRQRRLEELRARLSHAETRLSILEAGGASMGDAQQQLLDTVEEGAERLPGEPRLDALVLDHARERVAVLQIALRAAQENVFLGDGYNDSPSAEQRATELASEIAALQTRLTEAQERVAAVRERTDRERLRVNGLTGGEMQSPVSGLLWEVLQADGVNVQRGDPLLRLVDCGATMVTASVTERVYNSLAVGDAARFRLGGASTVYDATVARLAGSGAETIYRNLAVAPSQRHLERYDVALIVPALAQLGGEGCMIGRTGRAFFDGRPLDGLRRLMP
ncbi:HlyD family secretion protein [Ponticoccus alexandrii]|uniref:HlyD family efflux transporter periplasmic adaptor subunit n=1 Tax=Ponticoccus alexandrii TaxID=1943633 RepID=A0ABX7FAM7_9RHOB|nr:HlyD family efflux transporter periplasmic adaptor subunit [Ponticoccus alexandrii]ETA52749.1 Curdlan synthesis protein [Rhodobacteraceae bacterium PD-2]QRF67605.1 HlyD family efflux transporter periplasmic adaptor subunit [Ponticoccus alexandrii]